MSQVHSSGELAAIGALSFGAGALMACGLCVTPFPGPLLALPIAGAFGGWVLARCALGLRAAAIAALRFAMGFGLSGLLVVFSLISLQARVEPGWGAIAWGLGLALGGGIGGGSLRRPPSASPGPRAALSFGLSGALGGGMGFALFPTLNLLALAGGMVMAFMLGGSLLGAAVAPTVARREGTHDTGEGRASS